MKTIRKFARPIACATIAAFATMAAPLPVAQAALVDTNTVVTQAQAGDARARIDEFFARNDVQSQMESMGVSPAEAHARVANLSDSEVADMANRIDSMPAGQGIIGLAVLVFVILVLTDILGFTHIFGFTNKGSAN